MWLLYSEVPHNILGNLSVVHVPRLQDVLSLSSKVVFLFLFLSTMLLQHSFLIPFRQWHKQALSNPRSRPPSFL